VLHCSSPLWPYGERSSLMPLGLVLIHDWKHFSQTAALRTNLGFVNEPSADEEFLMVRAHMTAITWVFPL
jgi:hypothetical protein